jgi:hypothetical protein
MACVQLNRDTTHRGFHLCIKISRASSKFLYNHAAALSSELAAYDRPVGTAAAPTRPPRLSPPPQVVERRTTVYRQISCRVVTVALSVHLAHFFCFNPFPLLLRLCSTSTVPMRV